LFATLITNLLRHKLFNHGRFGVTEILVILAVVLLLFGGKKFRINERLGSGIKEFKMPLRRDPI
jgi:sec-independent protein translocase protein TatA